MAPRTIDNLGYDASQRYAIDQHLLSSGEKVLSESRAIFGHTQVDVTSPSFNSEVETLFNADQKNPAWAEFEPPLGYTQPQKRFFTYQLLPSLSMQEHNKQYEQKILAIVPHKDSQEEGKEKTRQDWESDNEQEKKEKEKDTLLNLLHCILTLDECMLYVNSKRAQYHKG
jgi:hypothetical protein